MDVILDPAQMRTPVMQFSEGVTLTGVMQQGQKKHRANADEDDKSGKDDRSLKQMSLEAIQL